MKGIQMEITQTNQLMDEITEFFASSPTLAQIADYKISEALDQRLHDLLDKNGDDGLNDDEQIELDEFLRMGRFLRVLKLKARLKLTGEE